MVVTPILSSSTHRYAHHPFRFTKHKDIKIAPFKCLLFRAFHPRQLPVSVVPLSLSFISGLLFFSPSRYFSPKRYLKDTIFYPVSSFPTSAFLYLLLSSTTEFYQIRQHDQLPFGSLPVVHNSPYGVINLRWESTKKQRKFGTLDPSKIIWKLPQKKQAINHFTSQSSACKAPTDCLG